MGTVVGIAFDMVAKEATVALDNRMVFKDSNAQYTDAATKATTKALRVGTLTVSINAMSGTDIIYTLDPSDPAVEGTGDDAEIDRDLAGNVDVVVKGAFKTGDMVVYGAANTEAKVADGMAAVSIPITAMGGSTDFIYVPGGIDALRPGYITAMASLNFSRSGNASGKPATSMAKISYDGVDVQAYAHGVVRGGGTDSSYVRVRCANATDCTVFADCHDQAGMNYFEEAGTIGAGATSVVSSDMIAAALGGGWESGRGACDLLSNGSLEVQHMVRSGHTLVNNSAVVGRSLSEARLDSIDKVLNDICSSVDGYAARDAADPDNTPGNTDDVSAIAATACMNALGRFGNRVGTLDTNGAPDGGSAADNGI